MKKPRSYPTKIRGVAYEKSATTPIWIYLDILDPTTKHGHRGSTVRLTVQEAENLRNSLNRLIEHAQAPENRILRELASA